MERYNKLVPGYSGVKFIKRLVGTIIKPNKCKEVIGVIWKNPRGVRIRCENIYHVLQSGSTVRHLVLVKTMIVHCFHVENHKSITN